MHSDTQMRLRMAEYRRCCIASFEPLTHQFSRVDVLSSRRCLSHPVQPSLQLGVLPKLLEFIWKLDPFFLFALHVEVGFLHVSEHEFHFVLTPVLASSCLPRSLAKNGSVASSGSIAANKSYVGPLRVSKKSRVTSRHLTKSRPVVVLLHTIVSFRRCRDLARHRRPFFPTD